MNNTKPITLQPLALATYRYQVDPFDWTAPHLESRRTGAPSTIRVSEIIVTIGRIQDPGDASLVLRGTWLRGDATERDTTRIQGRDELGFGDLVQDRMLFGGLLPWDDAPPVLLALVEKLRALTACTRRDTIITDRNSDPLTTNPGARPEATVPCRVCTGRGWLLLRDNDGDNALLECDNCDGSGRQRAEPESSAVDPVRGDS